MNRHPSVDATNCPSRKLIPFILITVTIAFFGAVYFFQDQIFVDGWEAPTRINADEANAAFLSSIELHGEIVALRHRRELKLNTKEAIFELGKKELLKEAIFGLDEVHNITDLMLEAFATGYERRASEWFNSHLSRQSGFLHGVRFANETGRNPPSRERIFTDLLETRNDVTEHFQIYNEATWILFCDSFTRAFQEGARAAKRGRKLSESERRSTRFFSVF